MALRRRQAKEIVAPSDSVLAPTSAQEATTDQAVIIRSLAVGDLPQTLRLSTDLGWPHRREDWRFLCDVGQGVVASDARGQIVGSAMWFAFGDDVASIGMIIVAPSQRNRGIGRKLMEAVTVATGQREQRLNSTAEGYRLYRSLGFAPVGTIVQHQARVESFQRVSNLERRYIRAVGEGDWATLVRLDEAAHDVSRGNLFAALERSATGVICERDGEPLGFALSRRFGHGHVIGPVIAETDAIAIALVESHLRTLEHKFVRVDVPLEALQLRAFLECVGLSPVGRVTAMVRGPLRSRAGPRRVAGLVSQALG
jgi:GNAT superfamily N-acetyltransferase